MKTELKDVIHLYLGCEVQTGYRTESTKGQPMNKSIGILIDVDLLIPGAIGVQFEWQKASRDSTTLPINSCKPILRQLVYMTQDEAIELSMICYKSIFGYTTECQVMDFKATPSEIGIVLFSQEQNDRIGFTVNESEIEFSLNSKTMIVNHYLVFLKLLQLGFDLFGLIESGQAIDKTTLKP